MEIKSFKKYFSGANTYQSAWIELPNLKYPKCWHLIGVSTFHGGATAVGMTFHKNPTLLADGSFPTVSSHLANIGKYLESNKYAFHRYSPFFPVYTTGKLESLQVTVYTSSNALNLITYFEQIEDPSVID